MANQTSSCLKFEFLLLSALLSIYVKPDAMKPLCLPFINGWKINHGLASTVCLMKLNKLLHAQKLRSFCDDLQFIGLSLVAALYLPMLLITYGVKQVRALVQEYVLSVAYLSEL